MSQARNNSKSVQSSEYTEDDSHKTSKETGKSNFTGRPSLHRISPVPLDNVDGAGGNVPDVVSDHSSLHPHPQPEDDNKDPDIVRSSSTSSSEEKPLTKTHAKLSSAAQSGSSFSSSGSSESDCKPKNLTVSSFSSSENDDVPQLATQGKKLCDTKQLRVNRNTKPNFILNRSLISQVSESDGDEVFQVRTSLTESSSAAVPPNTTGLSETSDPSPYDRGSSSSVSDKGQQGRRHYRSSGYGTGSGDSTQGNSSTNTSAQLSQESTDVASGTAPQGSDTETVRDNALRNSRSQIENDFSPYTSSPYRSSISNVHAPVHMPASSQHRSESQTALTLPSSVGASFADNKSSAQLLELQTRTKHCSGSTITSWPEEEQNHKTAELCPPESNALSDLSQQELLAQSDTVSSVHHQRNTLMPVSSSLQQHHSNSMSLQPHPSQSSTTSSLIIPPSLDSRLWKDRSYGSILAKHLMQQSAPGTPDISRENHSQFNLYSLLLKHDLSGNSFSSASLEGKFQELSPNSLTTPVNSPLPRPLSGTSLRPHEERRDTQQKPSITAMPDFSLPLSSDQSMIPQTSYSLLTSLGYPSNPELLRRLTYSSRCQELHCEDDKCEEIKKEVEDVENSIREEKDLNMAQRELLFNMFDHIENCSLHKCPFRWCGGITLKEPQSLDEIVTMMSQRLANYAEHCPLSNVIEHTRSTAATDNPSCIVVDRYMKLTPTLNHETVPLPGRDWTGMCLAGHSSSALVAMPHQNSQSDLQYWVIKLVKTVSNSDDSRWELYSKLGQIQHESVINFLWAANLKEHNFLIVCSDFEVNAYSLHESLQALGPNYFKPGHILHFMWQMTRATRHLNNDLGIVFLNWTSSSILVVPSSSPGPRLKLSNFSCSTLLNNSDSEYPGHLTLALPPHLLAPELLNDSRVELASDIWGLGCFLYELVTGRPVWHEHRHLKDDDLKVKMGRDPCPNPPTVYPEFRLIFESCWKINPDDRCTFDELDTLLVDAFRATL